MTELLQTAWREALVEFIANDTTGDRSMNTPLQEVIDKLRSAHLILNAKDKSITSEIWQLLHLQPTLFNLVMHSTMAFKLEIGDQWDAATDFVATHCRPFTSSSKVVGKPQVDSLAPTKYLLELFRSDPWVMMLFFAATQQRITIATLGEFIPPEPAKPDRGGKR